MANKESMAKALSEASKDLEDAEKGLGKVVEFHDFSESEKHLYGDQIANDLLNSTEVSYHQRYTMLAQNNVIIAQNKLIIDYFESLKK